MIPSAGKAAISNRSEAMTANASARMPAIRRLNPVSFWSGACRLLSVILCLRTIFEAGSIALFWAKARQSAAETITNGSARRRGLFYAQRSFEQFGVSAGVDEIDAVCLDLIDQQEIAAN
jgi:hypothetical protein